MPSLSRDKIFLNIAFSLLLGIFSIYMLSSLGFIFKLSINLSYILISVLLLILVPLKYFRFNVYESFLSLIFVAVIIITSYFYSAQIADFSYDGPWYHQTGILFLKRGWNPIYTSAEYFFRSNWNTNIDALIWIDSYPKFYEIFAANVFYLTNKIEAGKMLNFVSLCVLFCYSLYVLRQHLLKKQPIICTFFSLLIVFNPIVCAQIYTYYVDGLIYIYFMLLLLSLIDIQQSKNENITARLILIMSATLLANLKVVSLLYTILILVFYACFRYFWKQKTATFAKNCAVIALLIILTGINPYFTNLYKGKHIFYPVAGSEKIDIMKHNMPSQFFNKPMPYKLFMSTFSKVDNSFSEFKNTDKEIQLKIPFTVYASEMEMLKFYDTRQCGFGIFWSGILLITFALAFFFNNKNIQNRRLYIFTITVLLSSVLFNTENWWARYVPQFYAVPIFVLLFYYINSYSRWRFAVVSITGILIFINSALLSWKIFDYALSFTAIRNIQLSNMEKEKGNRQLIEEVERLPIQQNFTAPILLFLDEANRK